MNKEEDEKTRKMYQKTHGLTIPGEQKKRDYNWPFETNNHVFGKGYPLEKDGCKKSLMTDFLESDYPKTKIVNKRLEDFRQATSDILGKGKFRGTLGSNIPADFVFGAKSLKEENWNASKCIMGDPDSTNSKMIEPDPDLGKSVFHRNKYRYRENHIEKVDYNRSFGVPSVRTDLKPKEKRSVCDLTVSFNYQNYGNEKDVFDLLYPNPFNNRGLDDKDFDEKLNLQELKTLVKKTTYNFPDDEIETIFEITKQIEKSEDDKITYKGFMDSVRNIKRDFLKYRTMFN